MKEKPEQYHKLYMEKCREKREHGVKAGSLHEGTSKEKKNASEKYAVLNVHCTKPVHEKRTKLKELRGKTLKMSLKNQH